MALISDIHPAIGKTPVSEISRKMVLDVVRSVEKRAPETARRDLSVIRRIMDLAVAEEMIELNPALGIGSLLPPKPPVQHRKTILLSDLPDLLARIQTYDGEPITRDALLFTLLTMARTGEVLGATASEIVGDIWRIPAERMKASRPHVVPLTGRALELVRSRLAVVKDGRDLSWTIGGARMSENTMLYALYRMGYHGRATVHGFRRLASTAMNEHGWNRDWVEMQLAHADGSVRGIYNEALYLEGRRKMLEWWDGLIASSTPDVRGGVARPGSA